MAFNATEQKLDYMLVFAFKPWAQALLITALVISSGCAAPSAMQTNPINAVDASQVRFLHDPPPNARFIAKVVYSADPSANWHADSVQYLTAKAVKLGGNVVVPSTESDWGARRINNEPINQNTTLWQKNAFGRYEPVPSRFHFWSNIYYSPE